MHEQTVARKKFTWHTSLFGYVLLWFFLKPDSGKRNFYNFQLFSLGFHKNWTKSSAVGCLEKSKKGKDRRNNGLGSSMGTRRN